MKRYFCLLLLVQFLVFGACNTIQAPEHETSTSTTEAAISTTEVATSVEWSTYAPKDIKLIESGDLYLDDWGTAAKYRAIYYKTSIISWILPYSNPEMSEAIDEIKKGHKGHSGDDRFVETDEMHMVALIKHFDILKEDFIAAIEKEKLLLLQENATFGWKNEFDNERMELPNADIIYTFDNEIINAYYRRENPVVPDWLK